MSELTEMELIEKEASDMTSMTIIGTDAVFSNTPGGFVSLDYKGIHFNRVKLVRLFPFTDPNKFISVRTDDGHTKEIGIIEDLSIFPENAKEIVGKQLRMTYFTPKIQKIIDIKDDYGYAYFHVLTDMGECKFAINMGSNAVSKLSDSRLIITDLDENRFEIPDVFALSNKEQRKLDLFL